MFSRWSAAGPVRDTARRTTGSQVQLGRALDGFVAGPAQSRDNPLSERAVEVHSWHIGEPRVTEADRRAPSG